jgi:transposase
VLKNLRDALEHFLKRNSKPIAEIAKKFKSISSIPINKGSKKHQERATTMLEVRRERILRARALFAEHQNIARVAKALPASKVFVRKAIRSEGLPDLRDNARATSLLERWVPELEARFVSGLRNAKQFWRELCELGFEGSYKRIHDWVRFRRDQQEARDTAQVTTVSPTEISAPSEQAKTRSFTPRQLVWLLLFADEKLNNQDAKILERLSVVCPDVPKARVLAQEFQRLIREKDVNALDAWFTAVRSSGLPDLMSFAVGLEREREPLEAAISEVWSNGRAEGHVNRLKLIKRQAYGQAGFELLRKRVLAA